MTNKNKYLAWFEEHVPDLALAVAACCSVGNLFLVGTAYESTIPVGMVLTLFFFGLYLGYNQLPPEE